ncbi:ankyrin repeat and SOCS box protein 16 isoform X1 [Betta splendens]|uniref:Ankyrin repeat and SOCS box protein 16 isoform X1 n=1 Tax=Betta splendens TaxID=158456 RepID=A0A6P7N393_BETSP|nr:ankyrin repeat and SOCS box protein 16 isoform X1 [Betta splendens]XP_055366686.1 ankyrin repeat and SOCS box protein 16 isoform X1 [Betta splendens]
MSKETFPFTSTSLRSLRLEQEHQEWEDARRQLARRRSMSRAPRARAPRLPPSRQRLQEVRAPPPPVRCRDPAVHNTFMCGDMRGVYAVLKDSAMVNAVMETVHEEMVWTPEMGTDAQGACLVAPQVRLSVTRHCRPARDVDAELQGEADVCAAPGRQQGARGLRGGAAVPRGRGQRRPRGVHGAPRRLRGGPRRLRPAAALPRSGRRPVSGGRQRPAPPLRLRPVAPVSGGSAGLLRQADDVISNACSPFPSCAELLLDAGADVSVRTTQSRLTPLHVAARRGLEEHVELLLSHGADVLATNQEGETPLNAACSGADRPSEAGRYLRVVQRLLHAGADPRTAGRKRHTPLHNACANCSPRIVEVLLRHGARADVANCADYTPLDCLLQVVEDYPDQQPEAVARSLLNHGARPVPPEMLRQCVPSPATLEVLLNAYTSVPPCEWMDSLSAHAYEDHRPFLDLVRERSGQPRSLQHLGRCALRRLLGARCYVTVSQLDIPPSVREYVLLRNDGTLQ